MMNDQLADLREREIAAEDVAEKAKVARVKAKHLGVFPRSPFKIQSRGFGTGRNAPRGER